MTIKQEIRALYDEAKRTRRVRVDLAVEIQQMREQLDAAELAEQAASQALLDKIEAYVST